MSRKDMPPGPGRPKGCKNKFTGIKEDILAAFRELGGIEYVKKCAAEDPVAVLKVIATLLPKEVQADVQGKLIIEWEK